MAWGIGEIRCRDQVWRFPQHSSQVGTLRLAVEGACALAEGAVDGDLGEGALENGEFTVVQLREE